jgi:DNA-binding CsgD family transcriptional regulator
MAVVEAHDGVERRHGLVVVPDVSPSEDRRLHSGRRWDDRPGELATLTFTHLLTSRPTPEEAVRLFVALLCWPIGAQGALVVQRGVAGTRTVARYIDQVSTWPDTLPEGDLPPEVADIVSAAVGAHPILWTQPADVSRAPMAAWLLGSAADPVGVLVLFLATPLEERLVAMRANSLAEILGLYLAGVGLDAPRASGRPSSARLGVEALSCRQLQILQMMANELTNPQIASRIGFSTSTVRMESLAIYRALGVHDRQHAVVAGRALGLLDRA